MRPGGNYWGEGINFTPPWFMHLVCTPFILSFYPKGHKSLKEKGPKIIVNGLLDTYRSLAGFF